MRLAVTILAAAALVLAPIASADGDPASDYLYIQDMFVPYSKPSKDATDALTRAIYGATVKHYRIKVAVIQSTTDMGSAGSFFDNPQGYANFLGSEIRFFFHAHLLVAMPKGFGLFYDGRPTKMGDSLLQSLPAPGNDSSALTKAAASAVDLLAAKDTSLPRYHDAYKPTAFAYGASGAPGKSVDLKFVLYDDSLRARAIVTIFDSKKQVGVKTLSLRHVAGALQRVSWDAPSNASKGYRFCVVAADPSGNRSTKSCAAIILRK